MKNRCSRFLCVENVDFFTVKKNKLGVGNENSYLKSTCDDPTVNIWLEPEVDESNERIDGSIQRTI